MVWTVFALEFFSHLSLSFFLTELLSCSQKTLRLQAVHWITMFNLSWKSRLLTHCKETLSLMLNISESCLETQRYVSSDRHSDLVLLTYAMWSRHPTNFCTGRLRPEVQPLTLLYTIFDRKGTSFVYLPLRNGTPFTYLLKSTASLFLTLGRKSSCRFHVAFNN